MIEPKDFRGDREGGEVNQPSLCPGSAHFPLNGPYEASPEASSNNLKNKLWSIWAMISSDEQFSSWSYGIFLMCFTHLSSLE